MKLRKQELADIFDDAADFDGSNELAFDARKALEAGTLEIEGYKQMKDVDSIDGKPLSEGEVALIRAIRRGTRLIDPLRLIEKEKEENREA